jgi:hypothetical protein
LATHFFFCIGHISKNRLSHLKSRSKVIGIPSGFFEEIKRKGWRKLKLVDAQSKMEVKQEINVILPSKIHRNHHLVMHIPKYFFILKKLSPYTLALFDLTDHGSSSSVADH